MASAILATCLSTTAREDLRTVLLLVQLDRPGAARAVANKLRCLADEAMLAGDYAVEELAEGAATKADLWHARVDVDDARVAVMRAVVELARALGVSFR